MKVSQGNHNPKVKSLSRYHLNRQRRALLAGGVVNDTRNEAVDDKRDLAPFRQ